MSNRLYIALANSSPASTDVLLLLSCFFMLVILLVNLLLLLLFLLLLLLLLTWPFDDAASKIFSLYVQSKALEKSQRAALWLGGLKAVSDGLRDSEDLILMTYA